jgi:hypothetical protein
MWYFAELRFADNFFFAGLKFPQIRKYILFLLTNMAYDALIKVLIKKNCFTNTSLRTVLTQNRAVLFKNKLICELRINHENLRICDLQTGKPKKFADLRQLIEPENFYGFVICGL